ncbi:MAG: hypothetical protein AAB250_06870, partial [Bdellovibrionota bacterium]
RRGGVDETAAHGDGFYTLAGREGARGSGWTIRFEIDSRARRGTDFDLNGVALVLVHNKRILKVIPESIDVSFADYFVLLGSIDPSDRGVLEKFKRRLTNRSQSISKTEIIEAKAAILARLAAAPAAEPGKQVRDGKNDPVLEGWIAFDFAAKSPEVIEAYIRRGDSLHLIISYLAHRPVAEAKRLLHTLISVASPHHLNSIRTRLLKTPLWVDDSEMTKYRAEIVARLVKGPTDPNEYPSSWAVEMFHNEDVPAARFSDVMERVDDGTRHGILDKWLVALQSGHSDSRGQVFTDVMLRTLIRYNRFDIPNPVASMFNNREKLEILVKAALSASSAELRNAALGVLVGLNPNAREMNQLLGGMPSRQVLQFAVETLFRSQATHYVSSPSDPFYEYLDDPQTLKKLWTEMSARYRRVTAGGMKPSRNLSDQMITFAGTSLVLDAKIRAELSAVVRESIGHESTSWTSAAIKSFDHEATTNQIIDLLRSANRDRGLRLYNRLLILHE